MACDYVVPRLGIVREFLSTPRVASGAYIIVTEAAEDWYELRLSDGDHTVTLDFPRGRESAASLDRLQAILTHLRGFLSESQ